MKKTEPTQGIETEITKTQVRWTRSNTGYREEEEPLNPEETHEERKKKKEQAEYESRRVHNREDDTIDLGNRRCTDMKNNRKITIPRGRPATEEAELMTRAEIWNKVVTRYINEKCDNRGNQKHTNLVKPSKGLLEASEDF